MGVVAGKAQQLLSAGEEKIPFFRGQGGSRKNIDEAIVDLKSQRRGSPLQQGFARVMGRLLPVGMIEDDEHLFLRQAIEDGLLLVHGRRSRQQGLLKGDQVHVLAGLRIPFEPGQHQQLAAARRLRHRELHMVGDAQEIVPEFRIAPEDFLLRHPLPRMGVEVALEPGAIGLLVQVGPVHLSSTLRSQHDCCWREAPPIEHRPAARSKLGVVCKEPTHFLNGQPASGAVYFSQVTNLRKTTT